MKADKDNRFNANKNRKIDLTNQPKILAIFTIALFSLIASRLFSLQILQGSLYRKLSEENRIRLVSSPPIRGRILDINGNILADSRLVHSLFIQPHIISTKKWPELSKNLSDLLYLDNNTIDQLFNKGIQDNEFSITLINEMSDEQVVRFRENENLFPGVQIHLELIRYYPFNNLAAHALGYTQFITSDEYRKLAKKGYKIKDRIGRIGLEAVFENHLRGEWGGEMLEVDAAGTIQKSLGYQSPKAGKDLELTLDLKLQLAAEKALEGKRGGAIVALDPRNGAIRAFASQPSFNPNFFTKSITTQKEYEEIFLSSQLPLLSRALNAYDPGSTWKVVTGMAGMESGKFPPNVVLDTVPCIRYGGHCFPEHNGQGFGKIGYEDALRVSSNTFFYQVGVGVGAEELYEAAIKLGFHSFTGIEIKNEESKGFVGNEAWAAKGRGWGRPGTTPWIPEDIASASIGQAVVQVTPLQLARAYAVFANGGYLITPHLVDGKIDWLSTKFRKKVDIKASTIDKIRQGLRKVAVSGTGRSINQDLSTLPPVAGKTGTAEDSTGGSDHAWFACFAPYESTEIVVVAFAQNTPGGGSVHALPMAREVLKAWHQDL
ncbi:penicillin-binding protein 2 [Prochlorococcus marinus]|uniref:Putative penicillin-binding protein n=1 Tax=Prochlorococcus marinus (strain MIT 9211) TaxID=93059 RepID=A9B9D7_PROM4|nr:penicillin-binding protein 2 [Prochlorococcus marinus]ABX07974.1 Putative penicillin-binding protein [Prochlorococcus marinus str. MIT 9211]